MARVTRAVITGMDARRTPDASRHILLIQDVRSGAVFAIDTRGYVSERIYWLAGGQEPPAAWHAHLAWSHYEPERWNAVQAGDPAEYRVLATWSPPEEADGHEGLER